MASKESKLSLNEAQEDIERFNEAADSQGLPRLSEYESAGDAKAAAELLTESKLYQPIEHIEVPKPVQKIERISDLCPALPPVELAAGLSRHEIVNVDSYRTSGRGSYMESGHIPEGQMFDPQFATRNFPDEWYLEQVKSTRSEPALGTGKVKIPSGTVWYQAQGTNSGYNQVTFRRAGTDVEYTVALPLGTYPRELFKNYPKGSYIALPGERGVINPEFQSKSSYEWRIGYDDYHSPPKTLLLENQGKNKGKWILPGEHSLAKITKLGSKRGVIIGTAKIEVENPGEHYAAVRKDPWRPWKVGTWDQTIGKNTDKLEGIENKQFTDWYKANFGSDAPSLPEGSG